MANENATVNIPADVIQPIVQARIQAAIVEALGRESQLIEAAVTAAMTQKVNEKGQRDSYDYNNKFTFLETMANQYIKDAAQEALKEHLQKAKGAIKIRVERELQKKQSVIAAALVDGFAKAIDSTYGFNLSISLKKTSD